MELSGKIVIITGASMGIGAATARAFAQAGAKVVLAARSADLLAALAREIGAERALAVPTDVTVRAQVDSLLQCTVEKFERIDILINNAGVGMAGTIATLNPANFEKIFATNVLGPLYAMQAVVPYLRQNGGGVILNVSSMVSILTPSLIENQKQIGLDRKSTRLNSSHTT
jgi:NADP-dependent 3-hydroxy acid dehydrogenase YdfG